MDLLTEDLEGAAVSGKTGWAEYVDAVPGNNSKHFSLLMLSTAFARDVSSIVVNVERLDGVAHKAAFPWMCWTLDRTQYIVPEARLRSIRCGDPLDPQLLLAAARDSISWE